MCTSKTQNGCQSRFHRPPETDEKTAELVAREEQRRDEERQRALDAKQEISAWLKEVRGKRGSEMLGIINKRNAERDHTETFHSLSTQGPYVGRLAVEARNQQTLGKNWGPPPSMTFLADAKKKSDAAKEDA